MSRFSGLIRPGFWSGTWILCYQFIGVNPRRRVGGSSLVLSASLKHSQVIVSILGGLPPFSFSFLPDSLCAGFSVADPLYIFIIAHTQYVVYTF